MKITAYDDLYPGLIASGGTTLVFASGSNSAEGDTSGGGDVVGEPGNYTVVGLRSAVALASNIGGTTVGDVLTIIGTSPRLAMFATPSNSGVSFGSNATRVSEVSAVGALSTAAREDHIHDGIGTITASSSNTLQRGTVNLRPGTNVSFGLSDGDSDGELDTLTINAAASGGGSGLTIEEVDGTPTATASKLVLPNGTLSYAGSVATYTPAGGSVSVPDVVQIKAAGNAATSITITAASDGHTLIMATNSTTGQVTSPSCTNTTWTQVLTYNDGTGYWAFWVGVVSGGASGTSITMTKPGSFNTVWVLEVTDTLTGTAGVTGTATVGVSVGVVGTLRVTGHTAGSLVIFGGFNNNTTTVIEANTGLPWVGQNRAAGTALVVAYATAAPLVMNGSVSQAIMLAEVT